MFLLWAKIIVSVSALAIGIFLAVKTQHQATLYGHSREPILNDDFYPRNYQPSPNRTRRRRQNDGAGCSRDSDVTRADSPELPSIRGEEIRQTSPELPPVRDEEEIRPTSPELPPVRDEEEIRPTSPEVPIVEEDIPLNADDAWWLNDKTESTRARATSPETISSLGDEVDGEPQKLCSICLRHLKNQLLRKLCCNHVFHHVCVTDWIVKSNTCPMCRTELV